ncbi:hypothetical protein RDI58_024666 [Solanum bulbocastanum]|uniref:Uncharacterized protein n=1 Tax=Solanum bulbocastanum TaxID=147425 RepID=A0AAN8SY29_SOLBU
MIQGHDEPQCYVEHPELHPARQNSDTREGDTGKTKLRQKELTEELETDANNDENHIKGKEGHGRILEGQFEEDRFLEGKQYKGGQSKKKINQVWNKVGIITTNKFEALNGKEETDNLEQQHQEISEGTKITTKQWVKDTSVPSKTAHEEKDIEEAGNTNSNVEKVMNQREENSPNMGNQEATSDNSQRGIHTELVDKKEEGRHTPTGLQLVPVQIASALREVSEEKIKNMHDLDEDEEMEENIQQISRAGDLLPRHVNSLEGF